MDDFNNAEFTEKERYWIDNLINGEQKLNGDGDTKSDTWVTNAYLDYLDFIIKYGNLRKPTEEYVPYTRVIKVNRKISKDLLKAGGYFFVIFNGVYVVQEVVFAKAEHCESLLLRRLNDNPYLSEHDLLLSSYKEIVFEDGEKWLIFLKKSKFTNQFLGYYQSFWDYPYIWDDECLT